MSHAEEDEAEGRETPAGSRTGCLQEPREGFGRQERHRQQAGREGRDEPKERVDRVRYEPDTEPPRAEPS
jgi:hypothetical protein